MTTVNAIEEYANAFESHGYVIVKQALDESQIKALLDASEEIVRSPDKFDFPHLNKYVCVGLRHAALLGLVENPVIFPLVVRLLKHYNIHPYTSQLIIAPPNREKSLGWHTDGGHPQAIAINGISALTSLKVGFFLTDASTENSGSIEVVPGSQYRRLVWKVGSHQGLLDSLDRGKMPGSEQLKLSAGDAVIFDHRLWHATAPNYTEVSRKALYYGYAYGQLRPLDYDTVPESLLDSCSPITQQMLGRRASQFKPYSFCAPKERDVPLKRWYKGKFGETWI